MEIVSSISHVYSLCFLYLFVFSRVHNFFKKYCMYLYFLQTKAPSSDFFFFFLVNERLNPLFLIYDQSFSRFLNLYLLHKKIFHYPIKIDVVLLIKLETFSYLIRYKLAFFFNYNLEYLIQEMTVLIDELFLNLTRNLKL